MNTALKYSFTPYSAVAICEGFEDSESEEQTIAAWQYLIDTELAWSLQGSIGRRAKELIDAGLCYLETTSQ